MKSAIVLSAVAAVVCASSGYNSLGNPSTGKCIVIDEYDDSRDSYSLTLGSCSDAVKFAQSGIYLKTDDGYCLSSLGNSGKKGNPVGLAACKSKPGKQWTPLSTGQWRNGYKLCLAYDSDSDSMIQASCQSAPLPIGSSQQYTFGCKKPSPPTPPPPPPKPQQIKCGQWSVSMGGPINSCGPQYKYTAGDYTTCSSDGSNCRQLCCTYCPPPPPSVQKCGSWSVAHGGPINSCGPSYQYTAGDYDTCAANGSNCRQMCCTYNPQPTQQSCGSWAVKGGGSPNCCGPDMIYTAEDGDMCNSNGSDCQSQCCSNKLY